MALLRPKPPRLRGRVARFQAASGRTTPNNLPKQRLTSSSCWAAKSCVGTTLNTKLGRDAAQNSNSNNAHCRSVTCGIRFRSTSCSAVMARNCASTNSLCPRGVPNTFTPCQMSWGLAKRSCTAWLDNPRHASGPGRCTMQQEHDCLSVVSLFSFSWLSFCAPTSMVLDIVAKGSPKTAKLDIFKCARTCCR